MLTLLALGACSKKSDVNAQTVQTGGDIRALFAAAHVRLLPKTHPATDFSVPLLGGGDVSLSARKGSVVLLNFWATWCPPCREEMPAMETLYNELRNEGLDFVAVNLGEKQDVVDKFITERGFTFPVALDPHSEVGAMYGIQSLPTTLILNKNGAIIAGLVGGRAWDSPAMIAAFRALLSEKTE